MKFHVAALDYDGTIATHDVLNRTVRQVIGELRQSGRYVVIATGRILSDLERIAGDLRFVDAVVAENGAVIAFPSEGHVIALGNRPPEPLLQALDRRRIRFAVGQCVVDAAAADAPAILEEIQALELPLALVFNRSRVMVLPHGITKATGLDQALRLLQRSVHNAVGIGDAENDSDLLRTCEFGVAAGWGSPTLIAGADAVIDGTGPEAVGHYLRKLAQLPELPGQPVARRRLTLGQTSHGTPVQIAVRGRNVLITGDARSGKSYVAGLLAEQLIMQRYAVVVIDPEGDYRVLESLPGVVMINSEHACMRDNALEQFLRHPELSVIIDLSGMAMDQKQSYVADLLARLLALRKQRGTPHRIVVDEAHYFLQDEALRRLILPELSSVTMVSYRASLLHADIWGASPVVISTRLSEPRELARLESLLPEQSLGDGRDADMWVDLVRNLDVGEAVVVRGAEGSMHWPVHCRLAPRFTRHVRHQQKYVDIPVMEAHAFLVTRNGVPTGERARTVAELVEIVRVMPEDILYGHLQRRDFSRWIGDVFGDMTLADQVARVEAHDPIHAGSEIGALLSARYCTTTDVPG